MLFFAYDENKKIVFIKKLINFDYSSQEKEVLKTMIRQYYLTQKTMIKQYYLTRKGDENEF